MLAGRRIKECRICKFSIPQWTGIWREWWYNDKRRFEASSHYDCWDTQNRETIRMLPQVPEIRGTTGRQKKDITPEQRKRRVSLLAYASQLRRQKSEQLALLWENGWMEDWNQRKDQFNRKLKKIWDELENLGGPPHKSFSEWTEYQPRALPKTSEDIEWAQKVKAAREAVGLPT